MAIYGPEAIDDAPARGPEQSAAIAAQAIEAQPSSGQISQREAVVAPNSILEKTWLT